MQSVAKLHVFVCVQIALVHFLVFFGDRRTVQTCCAKLRRSQKFMVIEHRRSLFVRSEILCGFFVATFQFISPRKSLKICHQEASPHSSAPKVTVSKELLSRSCLTLGTFSRRHRWPVAKAQIFSETMQRECTESVSSADSHL